MKQPNQGLHPKSTLSLVFCIVSKDTGESLAFQKLMSYYLAIFRLKNKHIHSGFKFGKV